MSGILKVILSCFLLLFVIGCEPKAEDSSGSDIIRNSDNDQDDDSGTTDDVDDTVEDQLPEELIKPTRISFKAGTNTTGVSTRVTLEVEGVVKDSSLRIYDDVNCSNQLEARSVNTSGTYSIIVDDLVPNTTYTFYAKATRSGEETDCSDASEMTYTPQYLANPTSANFIHSLQQSASVYNLASITFTGVKDGDRVYVSTDSTCSIFGDTALGSTLASSSVVDFYGSNFVSPGTYDLYAKVINSSEDSTSMCYDTGLDYIVNSSSRFNFGSLNNLSLRNRSNSAYGDFDNDGNLDLISRTSGDILVNLGAGNGSFGSDITTSSVYFGSYEYDQELIVADINGDGNDDFIASMGFPDKHIKIYLSDGDGTFSLNQTINMDDRSGFDYAHYSLSIGDVNNDNNIDIIYVGYYYVDLVRDDSVIIYYLGNGAGSFSTKTQKVIPDLGGAKVSVRCFDFNSDGYDDLVVGDSGNSDLNFYLNDTSGGFSLSSNKKTDGGSLSVGDVNSDGYADLVKTSGGSPSESKDKILVYLNNNDGTFTKTDELNADLAYFTSALSLAVADFDSNGKMDLVVTPGDGNLQVFFGNNDGTFEILSEVFSYSSSYENPIQAFVDDFNNDGKVDLVYNSKDFGAGLVFFSGQ